MSVGLTFGSATSGTGFDVASTVTSILAISSAIETPWKSRLTALASQDSALTAIGTNLSTLSTALSTLSNSDGILTSKIGSSSDTNVVSLTSATAQAVAGSHSITVQSLATTSSQYSSSISSKADTLAGSLTLQIGSGSSQTLTIDSSNNTLTSLAAAINAGSYGVNANVVTDTNGSRLSLVSQTGGAAGAITLNASVTDTTTSANVSFATGQAGADAQFTLDGLATTSATNVVTNAIPGVTFQLLSTNAGTPLQVQIQNDNSSIETAFQAFATAYNAVVTSLSAQEGQDATGAAQPLYGNPTLGLLQSQLASGLLGGSSSGSIKNLSQLGLSLGLDGKLTLDASKLDTALQTNFSDVSGFLQSTGSFGQTFSKTLNTLGSSSTTGAVSLALQQNATDELSLNANITTEEALLADQKTRLTTELTTANQILQSIPQQLDEQTQIYNAITGYKGG